MRWFRFWLTYQKPSAATIRSLFAGKINCNVVDSSGKCNRGLLKEYLMWRLKSKGFTRPVVESRHDLVHLLLGDACKGAAFGKILPHQADPKGAPYSH